MKMTITDEAYNYLERRKIANKILVLIVDDGGGKYSIGGGACSIGSHLSIIYIDKPDPDYPIKIANNHNLDIYTSSYDETMLDKNLILDYQNASLLIKGDSGLIDSGVEIGDGAAILKADHNVKMTETRNC